jgi:hypothetical protein
MNWKSPRFLAMDAGTSEGARKAAQTRGAHGAAGAPKSIPEVAAHHGWRAPSNYKTRSGRDRTRYEHPSHPGHSITVSAGGSWHHNPGSSGSFINQGYGKGHSHASLHKHLTEFHATRRR